MTHVNQIRGARHNVEEQGTPPILVRHGDWGELRLNRPKVHNRLEVADIEVLRAHIKVLNADPHIRVVMLTAVGSTTFCSGFHIDAFQAAASKPDHSFEDMVDAVESMRALTVARVNGSMYGGGADLALACDFRIGVYGSRMNVPAAKLGLHFYGNGLRRWVSRLGSDMAKRVFLAAQPLSAEELVTCGFYTHALQADQLDEACMDFVEQLRGMAPNAVQGMKRIINEAAIGEYDRERAARQQWGSLVSEDFLEGRAAYAEKRLPVFRGA